MAAIGRSITRARGRRIGQTRKVVAFARRKAALFRSIMDEGDVFASSLTADDIRGLLA